MKNLSSLTVLFAVASVATTASSLNAAPPLAPAGSTATTRSTPATEATPSFEPAAVALLDTSARAYAALKGLSMSYKVHNEKGSKISDLAGTITFYGPAKAKVVIQGNDETVFNLTDGVKLYVQVDATTVQGNPIENTIAREVVLGRIPSALSVPLPVLVAGKSPLTLDHMKWQSARLLPNNEVQLVALPGGPPLTFNLYFDPSDKLLRRVEFSSDNNGQKTLNVTVLSNVQVDPVFAADAFSFKAGHGLKEVAELPMFAPKLKVGVAPFALKSKDLGGKTHSWQQYAGKVVLLDFWATWCGPCVGELPNVLQNYKKYHSKGLEIIGVSLDDDKKTLTDFVKTRNLSYVNLFDGKGWGNVDAKSYGVRAVPFTLLIGKDGKIAAVNPRGEKLEPAITKALGH